MDEEEKCAIFSKAVKTWGVDAQIFMAFEEMAELTKELCKLKRKNYIYTHKSIQPLLEEIEDVRLMLDQVAWIFNITDAEKERGDLKLRRLAKRLEMRR